MPGVPCGMACDSLTGLCITVGHALGLCSEIVPTGKPSAYGLRFAFRKSLVRLHNSLGSFESVLGNLPRGQFYLPTPVAVTLFIRYYWETATVLHHWQTFLESVVPVCKMCLFP